MQLKTLGGLALEGNRTAGAASQRRRLALLAVVAAAGSRGISRDKLLGLFWAGAEPERARGALAQALYALRRDLGLEDLFLGTADLRLNAERVQADVVAFREALDAGRPADAVRCYGGPFLDGVFLSDAPEFERWVESERNDLARAYAGALERLAAAAAAAGDPAGAVTWWRRLASHDPLDARVARELMTALAAAGDRPGAIRHARLYETLVREELEVEPDPGIARLAESLQQTAPAEVTAPPRAAPALSVAPTSPVAAPGTAVEPPATAPAAPPPPRRRRWARWVAAAAGLGAFAWFASHLTITTGSAEAAGQWIAVGRIVDHTPDSSGRPVADLLATNLARLPGVTVVSSGRMLALIRLQRGADSTAAILGAARQAGATELVDGAVYRLPDGGYRLDLRRTDLVTGEVRHAETITGGDLFLAVDGGTERLAAGYGPGRVRGPSVGDVTTRSLVAYRLYVEGLRAYYGGNRPAAYQLFEASLREDSTFPMAAYYAARAAPDRPAYVRQMQRALTLTGEASDRERLLIQLEWASEMDDPVRLALAETLATRYPAEPEGHLRFAVALKWDGRFLEAIPHLQRAIAMDSLSLREVAGSRCVVCEAFREMADAYRHADSLPAAERVARRWTRAAPGSAQAWLGLADVLMYDNRFDEALSAWRTSAFLDPAVGDQGILAMIHLRAGDHDQASAYWLAELRRPDPVPRRRAAWWLALTRRSEGRLAEALEYARLHRSLDETVVPRGTAPYAALLEAQILFDRGEFRRAAALFDSIARAPLPGEPPSRQGRHRAWTLTHVATALHAAGDTVRLSRIADSVEAAGRVSAYGRDHRLHHHVRGLLYAARGRTDDAAAAFARAIFSPPGGYTRTNYELGRSYLALGRPDDAVRVLRAVLHGPLEASGMYLAPADLRLALAEAHEAAGQPESAAAQLEWVRTAWRTPDPAVVARRAVAEDRLLRLRDQPGTRRRTGP